MDCTWISQIYLHEWILILIGYINYELPHELMSWIYRGSILGPKYMKMIGFASFLITVKLFLFIYFDKGLLQFYFSFLFN